MAGGTFWAWLHERPRLWEPDPSKAEGQRKGGVELTYVYTLTLTYYLVVVVCVWSWSFLTTTLSTYGTDA